MIRIFCLALAACAAFASDARAQYAVRTVQAATVVREQAAPEVQAPASGQPKVERSAQEARRAGGQDAAAPLSAEQLIGQGWEHFRQGRWAQAEEAFAKALGVAEGETASRARLGLGYAAVRLGKLPEARENFEKAAAAGYEPQETLPALLTVLKAQGDRKAMERYLAMLSPEQRAQWQGVKPVEKAAPAADSGVRGALADAGAKPSADRLEALLERHKAGLGSCADGDVYLKIAQGLAAQGRQERAKPVLAKLAACPGADFGVRLGALYDLASLTSPDIARDHLRRLKDGARGLSVKQQAALDELSLTLDRREMGQEGLANARRVELARSILAASPKDPDAMAVLAWDDLSSGRHAKALEAFDALAARFPERPDAQLGRGYALYQLGRLDDALAVAGPGAASGDQAMRELAYRVHVRKAFAALEAKDYAQARAETAKARALWPEGGEVREVEAWAALAEGDNAKAREFFEERYKATSDKRFLSPLATTLAGTGRRVEAFQAASKLAAEPDPQARKEAARFYQEQKAPMLAAKADPGSECCAGAVTQMIDARGFVRAKTGDPGTSRLTEWSAPVGYSWAHPDGWRLGAVYTPSHLYSGNSPADPYVGSYYARVAGAGLRNSLVTDVTVHTPDIFLDVEGPYRWRFEAGTTPIGGPAPVMATFLAGVSSPDFEVRGHQKPVTESILSWVGQRDPYGSKTWGRVVRTGAQGTYVFSPWRDWFLSLGGGADYLWGHNVADNAGVRGNVAAGRTFTALDSEIALGGFATIKHFARNLNFHTFGNGGYYSPDLLFIAGPFLRLRSPECRDYWYDLEGSVGYMYERTAGASKYPLAGAPLAFAGSGQLAEYGGSYSGKTESKFAYSAKGEALKLLTPHLAAGVFGGFGNAADYSEFYAGLGLRFYLDPQKAFWAPKSLFRTYTPLDRD